MQKSFDPDPVNCSDLFSSEDDLYRIPRYQRPYSWEESHLRQLFDDLYEAWQTERDAPYFLGSVIVVGEEGENRLSILDGQQRITTLTITYAVLNDRYSEFLEETNQRLAESRIREKDLQKPRLRSDKQADLERSVIDQVRLDEENRYTNAADVVIDELDGKFGEGYKELDDFFNYLDKNVEMIKIFTNDLGHAVRLFQTINTRGKDLTVSDLTKSYLLSHLEDDEDKDDVIEVWQEITGMLDDDYEKLDDILGMYRLYLQVRKAKKSAYEELKGEFEGRNPKDDARDIRDFVDCYLEVENARDRWTFMLDNLTHDLYWRTILVTARKEEVDYYDDLKEALVAFYYSYWIGDYTAEKIKLPSIDLLDKVKSGASFEEIQDFISETRKGHRIQSRVQDELNDSNVFEERWHKRLLIAIEYLMSTPQKIEKIDPGSGLHREHVLPKSFESAKNKHTYWGEKFEDIEAERLKNSLGNLVPLQYDLNSAAAQRPFPQKVNIYKGEEDHEKSSFDLTLRVADRDLFSDWNPQSIQQNKEFLLEKSAELLDLPVESIMESSNGRSVQDRQASE